MSATPEELNATVAHFCKFKKKKRISRLLSIEVQFVDMARGGDGTAAEEGEIKNTYYPTWTTKDFQTVCNMMGWEY